MSDWGRVKSIFEEVVERPSELQESLLSELCGGDACLRSDVERLLTAHGRAGAFLESPPTLGDAHLKPSEADVGPRIGDRIGPYSLVEVLGEGGFGTVFRAEQEAPIRRTVALKLLKPGMDTREVVRRFKAERQALALMDHPNIATALDAGATVAGRPYFVMELVQGAPLTEFCDQQRLGLTERLDLMIEVCNAVQHAHQKGIIHRDLKPSNLLVTHGDGRPAPKIIDFGVAKAIDPRRAGQTLMTASQQLVGTPAYMSPEQARPVGGDVDTRSDIYSLGVILYELITGVLPYDRRAIREATLSEFQQMVLEHCPPRPSTRLSRLAEHESLAGEQGAHSLDEIAALRGVSPRGLRTRLRGDLDWIVMKCLEKDRERRYAAAGDLARDLERHQRNEPVLAGPPSARYRVQKFVQRHRGAVLATCSVALALILGLALAISGFVSAESARQLAEKRRLEAVDHALRAETEARKAQAVNEFLQKMLASANPRERAAGDDVTVRQVLREASARLSDGSLAEQPEIEAAVRMTVGAAHRELAQYAEAEAQFRRAIELRERLHGRGSVEFADALCGLAAVQELNDQHEDSERHFREALAINRAKRRPTDREFIVNLSDLATSLNSRKRFAEAEALNREALAAARLAGGDSNPDLADPLNNLGLTLSALGRIAEAEACFREALQINQAQAGRQLPAIATNLDNLATALVALSRPDEAEAVYHEALQIREALFGDSHPDVAYTLHNLAALQFALKRDLAGIEALLRRAYEILKRIDGLAHLDTLTVLDSLVSVVGVSGKLRDAESLLLEAWSSVEPSTALPDSARYRLAARLGQLYDALDLQEQAQAWHSRAAATTQPTPAATQPDAAPP